MNTTCEQITFISDEQKQDSRRNTLRLRERLMTEGPLRRLRSRNGTAAPRSSVAGSHGVWYAPHSLRAVTVPVTAHTPVNGRRLQAPRLRLAGYRPYSVAHPRCYSTRADSPAFGPPSRCYWVIATAQNPARKARDAAIRPTLERLPGSPFSLRRVRFLGGRTADDCQWQESRRL